jgi:hypothetical protein
VKTQKLRNALNRVPNRTMKDAFNRVIGDGSKVKGIMKRVCLNMFRRPKSAIQKWIKYSDAIDNKKLLDNTRSERLRNAMKGLPRRKLKDAFQRIHGEGNKVKGAIKTLIAGLLKKPQNALRKLRDNVNLCKNKQILDALKTQKLKFALAGTLKRGLKDLKSLKRKQ